MHVTLGPSIPLVPVTHFSKLRMTRQQWEDAWHLVGPSVDRNIWKQPLWMVIAAAYVEGVHHGSSIAKERMTPADGEADERRKERT